MLGAAAAAAQQAGPLQPGRESESLEAGCPPARGGELGAGPGLEWGGLP